MGGISEASVAYGVYDDRQCLVLSGDVCLENKGGFIQVVLNLAMSGETFDASSFIGIQLVVRGNDEQYSLHIRTPDNVREHCLVYVYVTNTARHYHEQQVGYQ